MSYTSPKMSYAFLRFTLGSVNVVLGCANLTSPPPGRVTLVEFDKGAKRETDAGREPFWTGLVQDGVLYGRNWMGKMMMLLREELSDN